MDSLSRHWPEYLMEAAGLGVFMMSAFTFGVAIEHPASPIRQAVADPLGRRLLMGIAMGLTAIAIIYSPWGKQSGAHINPSVTLAFVRLGKVKAWDGFFYVGAQFLGGLTGALIASALLSMWVSHPTVNYVVTEPGVFGVRAAIFGEMTISFILMFVVLTVSNIPRLHRWTGFCAGILVAIYITFEAPISGMSMNPARTLASALPARHWQALWLYFIAPVFGMFLAAETYTRIRGAGRVACAKLHHQNDKRCIFCSAPADTRRMS